jgi:hypothetical protein
LAACSTTDQIAQALNPSFDPATLADGVQQPALPSPAADVQTSMPFFTQT